ncbi:MULTISPECIES: YciI family protein [unclassified Agrococcus]|uniref:YciI family protein n=1 Tax=unclassified Agrococcus TaxID=2615065 RepID=UPI0036214265
MQYALVYSYDPTTATPADGEVQDWFALDAELAEAGVSIHEAGFHPIEGARVVTVRDGEVVEADAPTSGSTVAGYYVVDVPDLASAVRLAARIPTAKYGEVAVRQIVDMSAFEA